MRGELRCKSRTFESIYCGNIRANKFDDLWLILDYVGVAAVPVSAQNHNKNIHK